MKSKFLLVASFVGLAITGCDSGDSGGSTGETVKADTSELKSNAVSSIGRSFDGGLNAVGTTLNQNADVGNTVNDVATGGSDEMGEALPTDSTIQSDTQNLFTVSLGTEDGPNSTTNRDGNTITVDPDEEALCRDEILLGQYSADEFADCTAFFKDVTVKLVASTDESGVMTYLYQQQPVIHMGYAPDSGSIELDLAGLKTVLNGYALINSEEGPVGLPSVMSGSFKFSATNTGQSEGEEAGSVSYSVVKPIRVVSSEEEGETNLSIEPGTVFSISADSQTGEGSLLIDLGAVAISGPSDSGLGEFNLAGFTADADVNPTDGNLVVRNFGLSKGPVSLSVNNEEVMSATLAAVGFQVSEDTDMEPGELIIDGNLDLSIMVKSFANNVLDDNLLAMMLDVTAPSGTTLSRAGNGSTKIGGAGPFTVSLGKTPAEGDPTVETKEVNSGECFYDLFDDEDEVAPPSAEQCL